MITSIIFSKDRPLQLDLTIRSIRENFFVQNNILVLYKETTGYASSYKTLQNEHPNVVFHKQGDSIFQDINRLVSESEDNYIVFFTDDNIFYRKASFTYDDMNSLFKEDLSCLSLRIGANTTQREIDGVIGNDHLPDQAFVFVKDEEEDDYKFIAWNRTTVKPCGYWSYALSVDGHIFEKKTIAPICDELLYQSQYCGHKGDLKWRDTPNEFESKLQRFQFEVHGGMAAPSYSCVVNSPNNRVQSSHDNFSGRVYPLVPYELNEQFQKGKRLNADKISFGDIVCPHTEIDLLAGLE
tara:strand:+ start:507 stop:1394 length:888 start_codon:yes stop_codon:yes gene_type:complete